MKWDWNRANYHSGSDVPLIGDCSSGEIVRRHRVEMKAENRIARDENIPQRLKRVNIGRSRRIEIKNCRSKHPNDI